MGTLSGSDFKNSCIIAEGECDNINFDLAQLTLRLNSSMRSMLVLTNVTFYNVFYNIRNDNYVQNNRVVIYDDAPVSGAAAQQYELMIPPGFYTFPALKEYLAAKVVELGAVTAADEHGFDLSVSYQTHCATLRTRAGFGVEFSQGLIKMLGMDGVLEPDVRQGGIGEEFLTGTKIVDMNPAMHILLKSETGDVQPGVYGNKMFQFFANICVDCPVGTVKNYVAFEDRLVIEPRNINKMKFSLVSRDDVPLMAPGMKVTAQFRLVQAPKQFQNSSNY